MQQQHYNEQYADDDFEWFQYIQNDDGTHTLHIDKNLFSDGLFGEMNGSDIYPNEDVTSNNYPNHDVRYNTDPQNPAHSDSNVSTSNAYASIFASNVGIFNNDTVLNSCYPNPDSPILPLCQSNPCKIRMNQRNTFQPFVPEAHFIDCDSNNATKGANVSINNLPLVVSPKKAKSGGRKGYGSDTKARKAAIKESNKKYNDRKKDKFVELKTTVKDLKEKHQALIEVLKTRGNPKNYKVQKGTFFPTPLLRKSLNETLNGSVRRCRDNRKITIQNLILEEKYLEKENEKLNDAILNAISG
uniref:BZIP domain-containing protein n=1 Tax=Panagrolaimus sp. ES5 TaxID=591445 RepID=A0AC34FLD4_9BILA